ncbi:MAG: RNA polymerase sigma factor [Planctomycetes bacterium]|nr:RNA polymerase sigma factor [Planctomycetota bacterium]
MPDVPAAPRQPHQDPANWARLLDTLDLSSVFVVLDAWLGPALRQHVQPEDVWQETLCCAWRDRLQHTWSTLSAYRAWLLTIARHRIADLARHQGRDKRGGGIAPARFSDLAAGEPVSHMLPAHTTTPSRIADHRERAAIMRRVLESLPPELGDIVRLRLFEELSIRAAAEQLGVALSTAKERFVRGLQEYQRRLQRELRADSHGDAAGPSP